MSALFTILGKKKFFKVVYSKENLPCATGYTFSIVFGLYYSLNGGGYILILALCF